MSQWPQLKSAFDICRVFAFAASCAVRATSLQTTWKVVGGLVGFEPAVYIGLFSWLTLPNERLLGTLEGSAYTSWVFNKF